MLPIMKMLKTKIFKTPLIQISTFVVSIAIRLNALNFEDFGKPIIYVLQRISRVLEK